MADVEKSCVEDIKAHMIDKIEEDVKVLDEDSKAYKEDEKEIPSRFILTGSGWGHGVGLCQIGAAVMGEQGYKYKEILSHYYPGSAIEQQYK